MKKVFLFIAVWICALMAGCSESEKVNCCECGDWVDRWIDTVSREQVCASCFAENGYQVCLNCGLAYEPGSDDADGYCGGCAETETWYCSGCEKRFSLDKLVQVDDGYYLCGNCLYWIAKPFDNAFSAIYADYISPFDLEEVSPFVSRNDELGIDSEWEEDTSSSVFDEPSYYFSDYETGYDDGYSEGYKTGHSEGYEEGQDSGKDAAYNEGYTNGYSDGKAAGAKSSAAQPSAPSQSSSAGTSGNSAGTGSSQAKEITVYITKTGEKYHRGGCQYLRQSQIAVSLSSAKAQGYTACSKCW